MNEPSNMPVMAPAPGPSGWLPVWTKAVTKPNEQTFMELTETPNATSKTAFLWVFIAGTLSAIVAGILAMIVGALGFQQQPLPIPGMEQFDLGAAEVGFGSLVTTICGAPIAGAISTLFFAIGVALIQWVAKLFGGVGTYDKLAYAFAAISVPITLISSFLGGLSAVPYLGICTGLVSFGLVIYALVLNITAAKAVNRFGWGQAAGSVLLPGLVILTLCVCLAFGLFAMMAPLLQDTLNQNLVP
jgi:hypothetical protein